MSKSSDKPADQHPLLAYRLKHNLSMIDLAELIGVDRSAIFRWETGDRLPSLEYLAQITKATGIPARDLRPDLADALEPDECGQ